MDDQVVEEYLDVLQNIEVAIVAVDNEQQDLTDFEVADVLDALIQTYRAEAAGRRPPTLRLTSLKRILYDRVHAMCEMRLGREPLESDTVGTGGELALLPEMTPVTPEAIVACLKRLQQSQKRWHAMGGRRGYLDYIRNFVR